MARLTCSCGECKKCKHREYMNRWYRLPGRAERARSWAQRYRNSHLEAAREYDRSRERRSDPIKDAARNATRKLGRGVHPCEVCGKRPADAHHDDYSKPLDVRWLCETHHGIEHRKVA